MNHPLPQELGEQAQRRVALAFTALIAAGATVLLVLTPALISGTHADTPYYRSPTLFPMLALALMAVPAAWQCLRLARGAAIASDDIDEPASNWRLVLLAFAAYAGYAAAVPLVGYVAATAVFLFALGALARLGWKLPLGVAAVLTSVLFCTFSLGLKVWLPSASLLAAL